MKLRSLIFGLTLATTAVAANEPVSIRVSPAVAFAPATLKIDASVEPDVDNRAIEIVADSEGFYRSSTIPLEGDRAPKTTTLQYLSLPPGTYEVMATLITSGGKARAVARAHVEVLGAPSSH
jgi:hypothetical protein